LGTYANKDRRDGGVPPAARGAAGARVHLRRSPLPAKGKVACPGTYARPRTRSRVSRACCWCLLDESGGAARSWICFWHPGAVARQFGAHALRGYRWRGRQPCRRRAREQGCACRDVPTPAGGEQAAGPSFFTLPPATATSTSLQLLLLILPMASLQACAAISLPSLIFMLIDMAYIGLPGAAPSSTALPAAPWRPSLRRSAVKRRQGRRWRTRSAWRSSQT